MAPAPPKGQAGLCRHRSLSDPLTTHPPCVLSHSLLITSSADGTGMGLRKGRRRKGGDDYYRLSQAPLQPAALGTPACWVLGQGQRPVLTLTPNPRPHPIPTAWMEKGPVLPGGGRAGAGTGSKAAWEHSCDIRVCPVGAQGPERLCRLETFTFWAPVPSLRGGAGLEPESSQPRLHHTLGEKRPCTPACWGPGPNQLVPGPEAVPAVPEAP